MTSLLGLSPAAFAAHLAEHDIRRACFILEDEQLRAYPQQLQPLADALLANERDFDAHEAVYLALGPQSGALFGAFVHRSVRGQAAGGVRLWPYSTVGEFLDDGLRLARGMGRKSALAGLWWGGGKGVIADPQGTWDEPRRRTLYREYGAFISSLRGYYVTAEDVGTQPADMAALFETTRHVTCIPPAYGGSGNPSGATARGVQCAMAAALEYAGLGGISGKTIVVQGLGNVARGLISGLLAAGAAKIIACDVADVQLARAHSEFGARIEIRQVAATDASIFREPCDVFSPCALGGVLHPESIAALSTQVVCGGANNQLLDERRDDKLLAERGIHYVPDFVANRMGIVNCANEQYGVLPEDPAVLRHFDPSWPSSVHAITRAVLERARGSGLTTASAANQLADELAAEPHPLWPGRGVAIRAALQRERWYLQR